jgi:hypothetical protein
MLFNANFNYIVEETGGHRDFELNIVFNVLVIAERS